MHRSKRWTKARDHDEIEIPTDETNLTESIATEDDFPVDATWNTTTSVLTTAQQSDYSTNPSSVLEVSSFEPQARIDGETLPDSDMDITGNFTSTFFTDLNESLSYQPAFDTNRTNDDVSIDSSLPTILFNLTTISYSIPGENPTDEEYSSSHERVTNATEESILALKDGFFTDHETDNLTETNDLAVKTIAVADMNQNETVMIDVESIPSSTVICDQSCQCSKACPYGFVIFNDTCECNPPCQVQRCSS